MNEFVKKEEITQKIKESSTAALVISRIAVIFLFVGILFNILGILNQSEIYKYCENIVSCVFIIAAMVQACSIFKKISLDGSPFIAEFSKKIKIIGYLIMSLSVVPQFVGMLVQVLESKFMKYHMSVGFTYILAGGLILFVGQMFSYGTLLQKESDETV